MNLSVNYCFQYFFTLSIYTILVVGAVYAIKKPSVLDPTLKVEIEYQGKISPGLHELHLLSPVSQFSFLGHNDILLLSKLDGKVLRVQNQYRYKLSLYSMLTSLINLRVVFLEWLSRRMRMSTKHTYFCILLNQWMVM